MYASDFPHVHLFDAGATLLDLLPGSMQNKVTSETARRLYRPDGSDRADVADGSHGPGVQEHG